MTDSVCSCDDHSGQKIPPISSKMKKQVKVSTCIVEIVLKYRDKTG